MSPVYRSAIDFSNPNVRLCIFHPRFHFLGFPQSSVLPFCTRVLSPDVLRARLLSFVAPADLISMLCVLSSLIPADLGGQELRTRGLKGWSVPPVQAACPPVLKEAWVSFPISSLGRKSQNGKSQNLGEYHP